eukprot:3185778-Rhodomonas_salina.1
MLKTAFSWSRGQNLLSFEFSGFPEIIGGMFKHFKDLEFDIPSLQSSLQGFKSHGGGGAYLKLSSVGAMRGRDGAECREDVCVDQRLGKRIRSRGMHFVSSWILLFAFLISIGEGNVDGVGGKPGLGKYWLRGRESPPDEEAMRRGGDGGRGLKTPRTPKTKADAKTPRKSERASSRVKKSGSRGRPSGRKRGREGDEERDAEEGEVATPRRNLAFLFEGAGGGGGFGGGANYHAQQQPSPDLQRPLHEAAANPAQTMSFQDIVTSGIARASPPSKSASPLSPYRSPTREQSSERHSPYGKQASPVAVKWMDLAEGVDALKEEREQAAAEAGAKRGEQEESAMEESAVGENREGESRMEDTSEWESTAGGVDATSEAQHEESAARDSEEEEEDKDEEEEEDEDEDEDEDEEGAEKRRKRRRRRKRMPQRMLSYLKYLAMGDVRQVSSICTATTPTGTSVGISAMSGSTRLPCAWSVPDIA